MHPEIDLAECRKWASGSAELLNHALRGIPPARVRYHTCYSINMGPRVHDHDIELKHIVDIILGVQAGAYSSTPPTRATSMSGGSGRRSNCRKAKSSFPV